MGKCADDRRRGDVDGGNRRQRVWPARRQGADTRRNDALSRGDLRGRPNLGTLMFTPYLRVLPMHLSILIGAALGGGTGLLVLFTVLKTVSDIGMDAVDRRMAERHADRTETAASPP